LQGKSDGIYDVREMVMDMAWGMADNCEELQKEDPL
jgi:hypothetical protein